jgi:hypothetical protein
MSCTIPANQPIYQALLNKATSYPADQWRAAAYRAAAETVRKYEANIYEEFAKYNEFACCTPTIGKSTEQFIRDFIKASPAPAAATVPLPKCTVPANEPTYQALLDKAASYPAEKVYQARAYRQAAEKLRTHTMDLFGIEDRTCELIDYLGAYWGPHVAEFIENFIVANKPSRPKCLWAPANEPIYKALLAKAAEATAAGKIWSARAWTTSAEKMSAATIDLVTAYGTPERGTDEYYDVLGNFGPKARELIGNYCKNEAVERRRAQMMSEGGADCFVPANNGLYNALLYRASKASNKYSAKHYTDAAAKVLASPRSLPDAWAVGRGEEAISDLKVGPPIVAYIKYYCNEIKGGKVFKYPTTDDEKVVEALKIYCIKNDHTYSDSMPEEYKKWLPNASKWDLEEYDYKTRQYKPKSVADLPAHWAANYFAALKPLNLANKYKQGVINYCKRNNIVYQPLMLERLNSWREANNDKLVYRGPLCGCTERCSEPTIYPLGHTAIINRWFATLPKSVCL